MTRIGFIACAIASSFAVAACGGSSSGGSGSASSSTAPQSSTPASATSAAFDKPASRAAAERALLTTSDFPAGWTSSPSDNSDNAKQDAQLAACLHVSPSTFGAPGPDGVEVDSPDFAPPGNTGADVSETVDVGTTAKADTEFGVLSSAKLPGCLDTVMGPFLKQSLAKDPSTRSAKIGTPKTTHLAFPSLGDETDAFTFTVPFQIEGQTATVYIDFVFIRNQNSGVELSFTSIEQPYDLSSAQTIARKALAKLIAAKIPSA
ncbi:MAG TPA: hypothetical protein VG899_05810 [Mycobacteriales bacterium]|nr:hypothetical protein [Mycobacteriales bacterium]